MGGVYDRGKYWLAQDVWLPAGNNAATMALMLVKPTYVFSEGHNTRADVESEEASGSGYGPRWVKLSSRYRGLQSGFVIYSGAENQVSWDALSAGISLTAVIYMTGASITDPTGDLVAHIDSGDDFPLNTNGGDVNIGFKNTGGLLGYIRSVT
jgi:hypothetical protein